MNPQKTINERLLAMGQQFQPRETLADAVMDRIGLATPRSARNYRGWMMKTTIGMSVAACLTLAILLVNPSEAAPGFDLPAAAQLRWEALATIPDYDVKVTPSVAPYTIQPDMSNVEKAKDLNYLSAAQKKLLAKNGFLILPSTSKEFYEIYHKNAAPFVTSDIVAHAYHVLLSETLQQAETLYLRKRQAQLARSAHKRMKEIFAAMPASLKKPATDALAFWAIADRLGDPKAAISPEVAKPVAAELARIKAATFIGKVDGQGPKRDYTVYAPIATYANSKALREYFVLNRYLTLATQPFDSARGAQTCLLIALAMGTDNDARKAYLDIAQYREFLGGLGEDPTPITLLAAARKTFGETLTIKAISQPANLAKLRKAIASQPRPAVADQPQDQPGADPMAGYGMRIFPPGVSVRALAYQDVARMGKGMPKGEHVAALLGTALPGVQGDVAALTRAKAELARRAKSPARQDVHTAAMLALSRLSSHRGKGYPSFMNTDAWQLKTANTQMGAWSELEHDLCLYLKDNTMYACEGMDLPGFHGYVEPVPRYYAALAALTVRTRKAFDQLGVFQAIAAAKKTRQRGSAVRVTPEHFKTLETMSLHLRDMAVKELANTPFNKADVKLLKVLKKRFKHLVLNDSNNPRAREPMSVVVRIAREYLKEEGQYVGVGRPMKILTIVPYRGKLHWAVGGVYSYYEFNRPLREPLTDRQWKKLTSGPLVGQPYSPWLANRNVGLNSGSCSAAKFASWLARQQKIKLGHQSDFMLSERFLRCDFMMRELNRLGSTRLTPEAMKLAGEAFIQGHRDAETLAAIYLLIQSAPPKQRAAIGAATLQEIVGPNMEFLSSSNVRSWIYFTFHLLKGTTPDAQTLARIEAIRKTVKQNIQRKYYVGPMKELEAAGALICPSAQEK